MMLDVKIRGNYARRIMSARHINQAYKIDNNASLYVEKGANTLLRCSQEEYIIGKSQCFEHI